MPDRFQTVPLPPISQGMVNLLSPSSMDDRSARRLLNMEYTLDDMPETRRGMTCWSEHSAASHPFNSRISSLVYFQNEETPDDGVLIATCGTKIYRSDTSINERLWTDITGTCVVEDDVDWTWRQFYDLYTYAGTPAVTFNKLILIGIPQQDGNIDGGTGGTNLVYWDGTGNMKRQIFNAINGFTLEEMNRRIFYVHNIDYGGTIPTNDKHRNKLAWSALGGAFHLSGSGETTANGSSFVFLQKDIVGLGRTRERLFIFHRDAIQQLKFGEPETDQNLFRIEMVTDQGGCVNPLTITPVLDDLYFLSDYGWVSMNAVQKFGDFEQALIGDKIHELKTSPRMGADGILNSHRAINNYEKNQVWISIPSAEQPEAERHYNKKCFVMHYRPDVFGVAETAAKFSSFSGRAPFTSACIATYQNRRRLFIASSVPTEALPNLHNIFLTDDKDVLEDDITKFSGVEVSEVIPSLVESKDYVFGNEGMRKEADYWAALFKLISSSVTVVFGYLFDYDPNKQKTKTVDLSKPVQDQWDEANWDSGTWAVGVSEYQKIERKFVGHPGRIFNAIRFIFKNLKGERFGFRGMSIDVAGIDEKESTDA